MCGIIELSSKAPCYEMGESPASDLLNQQGRDIDKSSKRFLNKGEKSRRQRWLMWTHLASIYRLLLG